MSLIAQVLNTNPYPGSRMIYKICTAEEWKSFQETGLFEGNSRDQRDGFIHISHAHQVERIAHKYFPDKLIVLLHIPLDSKLGNIHWEPNSSGDLFPHLYGSLKLDNIQQSQEIKTHEFDFNTLV